MEFFEKLDAPTKLAVKVAGIIFCAFVLVAVLASVRGGIMKTGVVMNDFSMMNNVGAPSVMEERAYEGARLSVQNVLMDDSYMPPMPGGGYTPGGESESFEVKEYNATIETRSLDADCAALRALKARTDVIFERASEYERGCSYAFKVKKGSVEEVLSIIKNLNPRELSENAYTIKREVDDYTSEVQILENKLASLDNTLTEAIASYGNITALATRVGDVESLSHIIESKLTIIERLTNARIETVNALERVNRAKAEALDRLEYTYMTVSVYENAFADGEYIKDSWKATAQEFVRETNALVQDMSIGLVALVLIIAKYALYAFVMLVVVKFGWRFAERIWKQ